MSDVVLVKRIDLGKQWVNLSLETLENEMLPLVETIMSLNIGDKK